MADFSGTRISERKFYDIEPLALTSNGTTTGIVTISSTYGFKVGQKVSLKSNTLQPRIFKVKKVISDTQLHVGDEKKPITEYADISDFLTVDAATIALYEQQRPSIDPVNIQGMVFEEEPTVALRSHQVDWLGRSYTEDNPIPVAPSSIDKYVMMNLDEFSKTTTYIGKETASGVWLIQRLVETGPDLEVRFANNSNNHTYTSFTAAWTNRLTLTYDLIENLTNI